MHSPKRPLQAIRSSKMHDNQNDVLPLSEMRSFFLRLWGERGHHSEISGEYLGKTPSSAFFHHILPKEKYPEAAFDRENIILLSLDEHTSVENSMYKYAEVNKRRDYLLKKYQ